MKNSRLTNTGSEHLCALWLFFFYSYPEEFSKALAGCPK